MPAIRAPSGTRVVDIFTGQDHRSDSEVSVTPHEFDLSTAPLRTLAPAEYLFEEGDRKTHAYRVESGALSLFTLTPEGNPELLDIVNPGSFVALGYLDRHACHARAECSTAVTCLSDHLVAALASTNAAFATLVDQAQRTELEILRSRAIRSTLGEPVIRTAAFLLVTSGNNGNEGRDPKIISDELKCGMIAGYLDIDVEDLAGAVRELARLGIVAAGPAHALRILDLPALERLVDGT